MSVHLIDAESNKIEYEDILNGRIMELSNTTYQNISVGPREYTEHETCSVTWMSECEIIQISESTLAFALIHEYEKHTQILYEPWFTLIDQGIKSMEGRLYREGSWVLTCQSKTL